MKKMIYIMKMMLGKSSIRTSLAFQNQHRYFNIWITIIYIFVLIIFLFLAKDTFYELGRISNIIMQSINLKSNSDLAKDYENIEITKLYSSENPNLNGLKLPFFRITNLNCSIINQMSFKDRMNFAQIEIGFLENGLSDSYREPLECHQFDNFMKVNETLSQQVV